MVPVVEEPLEVPAAPIDLFGWLEEVVGPAVPLTEPLVEPMPDAEPEAEPVPAHAANARAHAMGKSTFSIWNLLW